MLNVISVIRNNIGIFICILFCVALWGLNVRNSQLTATNERLEKLSDSKDAQINLLRDKNDGLADSVSNLIAAVDTQNKVVSKVADQRAVTASQNRKLQDEIKKYLAADKCSIAPVPLMLLSGCAKTQTEYETVKVPSLPIPASLQADCVIPDVPESMTYADSIVLNLRMQGALEDCNNQIDGIRHIEEAKQK